MTSKPIFVATHPRACSTAFERVFMTRHDTLQCVHEPFGEAYYFGPERLAERYENDPKARKESGYENSTYRSVFDHIVKENSEVRLLMLFFRIFCSTTVILFITSCIHILLATNSIFCYHFPVPDLHSRIFTFSKLFLTPEFSIDWYDQDHVLYFSAHLDLPLP
jgi:hypothetical protein